MSSKRKETSIVEESEQVEVSANKLQMMIAQHQEYKENIAKEMAKLKGQLKAREEQIKLYSSAIDQIQISKQTKSAHAGEGTKKLTEVMTKAKEFDEWYEKNKEELIEKEYAKFYKQEVDELKEKLSRFAK